jgi:hypothetical protein
MILCKRRTNDARNIVLIFELIAICAAITRDNIECIISLPIEASNINFTLSKLKQNELKFY